MATKVTGHGGYIVRGATAGAAAPFERNVRFDVGAWDLDVAAIVAAATESDALGWSQGLTGRYKVNAITIELIQKYEAAAIFELACCPLGGTVSLWLGKGASGFGNQVLSTIFRGLRVSDRNDNGEPIRQVAMFEYGICSFNVAAPIVP